MKILKRRNRVEVVEYSICYYWKDSPDAGFAFPADSQYNINFDDMPEAAMINYQKCLDGTYDVVGPTPERLERSYMEDAVGECGHCQKEVYLSMSLVNPCECGRNYNASGQLLRHESQWGEDTGESISEIMQGNLPMHGEW